MSAKTEILNKLKAMGEEQLLGLLRELGGSASCHTHTTPAGTSRGALRYKSHTGPCLLAGGAELFELEVQLCGRVRLQALVAALLGARVWLGEISEERIISIIEKVKK